jgi:hypothetical protein
MKKIAVPLLFALIILSLNGCPITANVIFTNHDADTYTCYVDGVDSGTVTAYGRLSVSGVTLGSHILAAVGTQAYSSTVSVGLGDNYWDFNSP